METLKLSVSFLLGLVFVFLYYRLLWISTKIRSRELKLTVKYGKGSKQVERFRRRFHRFYFSRTFRLGLFILTAYGIFLLLGKEGLEGFFFALIVGNLLLFPWGWRRSFSESQKGEEIEDKPQRF